MSARTDAEATNNQLSSGVTPEHLQTVLKDKLEAQHVEIADLSGTYPSPPRPSPNAAQRATHMQNRIQSTLEERLGKQEKNRKTDKREGDT